MSQVLVFEKREASSNLRHTIRFISSWSSLGLPSPLPNALVQREYFAEGRYAIPGTKYKIQQHYPRFSAPFPRRT